MRSLFSSDVNTRSLSARFLHVAGTLAQCVYPLELVEEDGVLSGSGLRGNFGPGERIRDVREDDDDATRNNRFTLNGTRTGGALVLTQAFAGHGGEVRSPCPAFTHRW